MIDLKDVIVSQAQRITILESELSAAIEAKDFRFAKYEEENKVIRQCFEEDTYESL